jgi:hypothetical protein
MEYPIHLAKRLGYDLVALIVVTAWSRNFPEEFRKEAEKAGHIFRQAAEQQGIVCEYKVGSGALGTVVQEICRSVRRIEFVITESESSKEEIADAVILPVFSVVSDKSKKQGGNIMDRTQGIPRKKLLVKTAAYGILSLALYAAVFINAGAVMRLFTKGGIYAALPIVTVFVFSFAHAAFAGSLWSLLGIEAMKRDVQQPTVQKTAAPKKQVRKRPRVYAYVNPFHRL